MTCPDNLLIASRRGALSDEEQTRLDHHLASCPTCRLTLRVGVDFDGVLETAAGDDLIAARFARNLGPKLEAKLGNGHGAALGRRKPASARRYAVIAAIAITASAGLAAAARLDAWPWPWPFALREAEPTVPDAPSTPKPPRKPSVEHAPAPEKTVEELPAQEMSRQEQEAEARKPSAAELFAQANARRRDGEPGRARSLYRQLQQLYPRSPELEVAHVSLGRVHLELGEPRDALEQFERYLSKRPRGTLAEEALFGKASALERLGRGADERNTWQALLSQYPSSVYAERARHRLERLP